MTSPNDDAKLCLDRVVEVYKARLAVWTAITIVTITLTGYGIDKSNNDIFLVAAALPLVLVGIDVMIKAGYAAPFLYKAAILDSATDDAEPVSLLFLSYSDGRHGAMAAALTIEDELARRKRFRTVYARKGIIGKALLLSAASAVEVALWWRF